MFYPTDVFLSPLLTYTDPRGRRELELEFHENSKVRSYWFEEAHPSPAYLRRDAADLESESAAPTLEDLVPILTGRSCRSWLAPSFSYCLLLLESGGAASYWVDGAEAKPLLIHRQLYPPNLDNALMPKSLAHSTVGVVSILASAAAILEKHGAARYRQALVLAGHQACRLMHRAAQSRLKLVRPDATAEDLLSFALGLDPSIWWILETLVVEG